MIDYINIREIDFKTNNITRDEKKHFIMKKQSTHQLDMTIIKISAPRELRNCEAKTEFKGEKIFNKKS